MRDTGEVGRPLKTGERKRRPRSETPLSVLQERLWDSEFRKDSHPETRSKRHGSIAGSSDLASRFKLESLILAQSERLRRA